MMRFFYAFFGTIQGKVRFKPYNKAMRNENELRALLKSLDRQSYSAYKRTKGDWQFPRYVLSIDRIQSDPFAPASDVSVRVENTFPEDTWNTRAKADALADFLIRHFGRALKSGERKGGGSGKSGSIRISRPGQQVLERYACRITPQTITLRFHIGFPAFGRRINSQELIRILFDQLPGIVERTLFYPDYSPETKDKVQAVRRLTEDQEYIRAHLDEAGLVGFVADDAILPRESGATEKPMANALPFKAPETLAVTMDLPNRGPVRGLGVPKGVTLILGGGYHGKSTLLEALEKGIYNHIEGDGRELVILDRSAVKSRAEDGRSVRHDDIAAFIQNLPNGRNTEDFSTDDASGSTSQAAGISEAVEAGARVLLMDEDTSATNFMIRDELMQRVIHADKEPIIPYIQRVREMYEKQGVSTILVAGSSGPYIYAADTIIQMDQYEPKDLKEHALAVAEEYRQEHPFAFEERPEEPFFKERIPQKNPLFFQERLKTKVQDLDSISFNHEALDLRLLEQLVDSEQLAAIGAALAYGQRKYTDGNRTLSQILDLTLEDIEAEGLEVLGRRDMAGVRKQDIAAAFNRLRSMEFVQKQADTAGKTL